MSWHDALVNSGYYDDYEPCEPDWRTLRQSTHTARTPHHCDSCDTGIQPGQRYLVLVALNEGTFEITRHHVQGGCPPLERPEPTGPAYWDDQHEPDEVPF